MLLQILEEKKRFGEWMAEYESALKKGVSPRQSLSEKYSKLVAKYAERAKKPFGTVAASRELSTN